MKNKIQLKIGMILTLGLTFIGIAMQLYITRNMSEDILLNVMFTVGHIITFIFATMIYVDVWRKTR